MDTLLDTPLKTKALLSAVQIIKIACFLTKTADDLLTKKVSMTYAQFKVLKMIELIGQPSQKEVAQELDLTPAAVSRLTEHLVTKKYVNRQIIKDNRRRHQLILTAAGRQKLATAETVLEEAAASFFNTLPDKKLVSLNLILRQIMVKL